MASGLCAALTGRTHGCTDQPANVKKTLANSEPSTHGTKRIRRRGGSRMMRRAGARDLVSRKNFQLI
jgi:hypothetical protein